MAPIADQPMIQPQQTTTRDHCICLQEARELQFFKCNLGVPSHKILGAFLVMYLTLMLLFSGRSIQSVGRFFGTMDAMADGSKSIGAMLRVGTNSRATDIQAISKIQGFIQKSYRIPRKSGEGVKLNFTNYHLPEVYISKVKQFKMNEFE